MIEWTARERARRALNSKTIIAGQSENYQPGDKVDFFRKGGAKDATGWTGPATVVDNTHISRGTLTIRHIHGTMEGRLADIRRHLPFLVFEAAVYAAYDASRSVWGYIRNAIEQLTYGVCILLGYILVRSKTTSDHQWKLSEKTSKHHELYQAIAYFAQSGLLQDNVVAARCGRGCASLPELSGYDAACTVWWTPGSDAVNYIT